MRTFKLRYVQHVDAVSVVEIETEVIVESDDGSEEAGRDAMLAIQAFQQGIVSTVES
jgi:hypothetical protein